MDKIFNNAISMLKIPIKQILYNLPVEIKKEIQEVRLRVNQPLSISLGLNNMFVSKDGVTFNMPDKDTYICDKVDLLECFKAICEYSVYTYQNQINQGFVTIKGGHRIGVCGSAVLDNGDISNVKNISSLNIRIAKEYKNCASPITDYFYSKGLANTIIIGPPTSGKTTILRDLAYRLSVGKLYKPIKVCVVDERMEICAVSGGVPAFDMGFMCDCMSGYPKSEGIITAIRSLSPNVIIFDEIGTTAELQAVVEGFNAGVNVISSVHSDGIQDFFNRVIGKELMKSNIFKYYVFLKGAAGQIDKIYERNELVDKVYRNNFS